eukprot:2682911-Karenia_brevis.AAC.1
MQCRSRRNPTCGSCSWATASKVGLHLAMRCCKWFAHWAASPSDAPKSSSPQSRRTREAPVSSSTSKARGKRLSKLLLSVLEGTASSHLLRLRLRPRAAHSCCKVESAVATASVVPQRKPSSK